VATAVGEIAPYKSADKNAPYDPHSLIAVINILRAKFHQAFEADQFKLGPTLALGVTDRLMLPNGTKDLAPYYDDPIEPPNCLSGVLWHSAYGRPATPVFGQALAGHANLNGHLQTLGVLVDVGRPFPGLGAIALERTNEGDRAWGLMAKHERSGDWGTDETREALLAICHGVNDETNSMLGLKR
jgi:hypothetical protein